MTRTGAFRVSITSLLLLICSSLSADVTDLLVENVPNQYFEAATNTNVALKLIVQDTGSYDILNALTIHNSSPWATYDASEPDEILSGGIKLWADADGNTTSGMVLLGSMVVDGGNPSLWTLTGLSRPVTQGDYLIVTFDSQPSISQMHAIQIAVLSGDAVFASGNFPATDLTNTDYQFLTVDRPANDFQTTILTDVPPIIGLGESNFPLLTWRLQNNPAIGHESDAGCWVKSLNVYFEDGTGPIDPSDVLTSFRIVDANDASVTFTYADTSYITSHQNIKSPGSLLLDLTDNPDGSSPFFQPGLTADLQLRADIKPSVTVDQLQIRIIDSTDFEVFDNNTSAPSTALASPDFPLDSLLGDIQASATLVVATFDPIAGQTEIIKGSQGVTLFSVVFQNPGTSNTGNVEIKILHFNILDGAGLPVVPETLLNHIQVYDGVSSYFDKKVSITTGNTVPITLKSSINVSTSGPITIFVRANIKADAIPNDVQFTVDNFTNPALWSAVQANVIPEVPVQCIGNTPFATASLPIVASLQASHQSKLPTNLYQGQTEIPVMDLTLSHPGPLAVGDVVINSLRFDLKDSNGTAVPAVSSIAVARLLQSGIPLPNTLTTSTNSFTLQLSQGITLAPSSSVSFSLSVDLTSSVPSTGLQFVLASSASISLIQPDDPGRKVSVTAVPTDSFPMTTTLSAIQGATLQDSFTNYPNPFHAGKESTTFTCYLPTASNVALKVFTLTGEPVKKLLDGHPQPAGGLTIAWDGRNEKNQTVLNGIYVAVFEITADGSTTKVKRMVAVIK